MWLVARRIARRPNSVTVQTEASILVRSELSDETASSRNLLGALHCELGSPRQGACSCVGEAVLDEGTLRSSLGASTTNHDLLVGARRGSESAVYQRPRSELAQAGAVRFRFSRTRFGRCFLRSFESPRQVDLLLPRDVILDIGNHATSRRREAGRRGPRAALASERLDRRRALPYPSMDMVNPFLITLHRGPWQLRIKVIKQHLGQLLA